MLMLTLVRMTDVLNVDESVVNDVTQGGIMTEVRTDVNAIDGKDDRCTEC